MKHLTGLDADLTKLVSWLHIYVNLRTYQRRKTKLITYSDAFVSATQKNLDNEMYETN